MHNKQYVCMEKGSRDRLNFYHISWRQEQNKAKFTYGLAVLRIRDVYPGSEFFPSRIRIKELKYLTQKKGF